MISKGTTHNNGARLAAYMTTGKDGERAELWELRGFEATTIKDAFRDVQAARADMERLQNEAYGYANKVVPGARGQAENILQAAEGYKQKVVNDAGGQTSRFTQVYDQYKNAPDVTRKRMYLETMERVLGGTDKIIIDGKTGQTVVPYLPLDKLQPKTRSEGAN